MKFRVFWKKNKEVPCEWIEEFNAKNFDKALNVANIKAKERNKKEKTNFRVVMVAEV
jgi:hypothetical protein